MNFILSHIPSLTLKLIFKVWFYFYFIEFKFASMALRTTVIARLVYTFHSTTVSVSNPALLIATWITSFVKTLWAAAFLLLYQVAETVTLTMFASVKLRCHWDVLQEVIFIPHWIGAFLLLTPRASRRFHQILRIFLTRYQSNVTAKQEWLFLILKLVNFTSSVLVTDRTWEFAELVLFMTKIQAFVKLRKMENVSDLRLRVQQRLPLSHLPLSHQHPNKILKLIALIH